MITDLADVYGALREAGLRPVLVANELKLRGGSPLADDLRAALQPWRDALLADLRRQAQPGEPVLMDAGVNLPNLDRLRSAAEAHDAWRLAMDWLALPFAATPEIARLVAGYSSVAHAIGSEMSGEVPHET